MTNTNQIMAFTIWLITSIGLLAQTNDSRTFDSFHGVKVGASVDAELVKGNENRVDLEVENVDLDEVKTEVENGILKVTMKSKNNWNGGWNKKRRVVKATITYADNLDFIGVGSSADLVTDEVITGEELELKVSSSGDMSIAVDVDHLIAKVSSSGDLDIEGSAHTAKVSVSSSGDFTGRKLKVVDADLKASSSADISIHVSGVLHAKASSSADIEYYGNPTEKHIDKSSQATVEGH